MNISRRTYLQAGLAMALPALVDRAAAQSYPTRAIQFFVSFGAGNAGDVVARIVAKKLAEGLGQPIVVENRPAPMVAATTVARARPDGYSLFMAGSGTALTHTLFTSPPYDIMNDFAHVSTMAGFDFVLLAAPQAALKTVGDVVAYAKANPGKLNMATARVGSTSHLAAEMFKSMTGIDIVLVPYKATGEIIGAVRGNQVQLAIELVPAILGQVQQNVLRAVAVTARTRFARLPDVPTMAESGVAGYDVSSWNGISVPASTPAAVVQRLAKEIAAAVASPDVREELLKAGATPMASTPEQMTERMRSDIAKWQAVVARANIPRQ
jgi:tripartite-type tricarboxylate transporter receptor subunit TctC